MKLIEIYTDGACSHNPGPGGWAALLKYNEHEKLISGFEPDTTNNKMELTAAIKALEAVKETANITIYTDSNYVKQGITKWIFNWQKNNWRSSNKSPIKNVELWQQLYEQCQKHTVSWEWVKAHFGIEGNERVDQAARNAIKNAMNARDS